jgi:hypothetical protein
VKLSFDLYRDADRTEVREDAGPEIAAAETRIAVRGSEPGGAAIPKVLEMLAARNSLTLDQLADAQLLGDYLAHWNSQATIDAQPLELTIEDREGALALRIGPLAPGLGRRMIEGSEVPGLGPTLERLAQDVVVEDLQTDGGPAECVRLEIRAQG